MGWMDKQMDRKVKQFTLRISSHNYGDWKVLRYIGNKLETQESQCIV
jgi:hypothetical protein